MSDIHAPWTEELSDYLNGDLEAAHRERLEEHLSDCAPCREALADLRAVVAAAGRLGEVQPPRDLWPEIAGAIDAPLAASGPTVIPLPTAATSSQAPAGLYLSRRQLAAAASILVVLSAAATWAIGLGLPGGPGTMAAEAATEVDVRFASTAAPPPESLVQELESLEVLLAQARTSMDPATVRILEKNLAVIETAIEDSYRALALDPENTFLSEHLQRAFQRKVDYLSNVAQVAGWAG